MDKYLKYSFEELLEDRALIAYILRGEKTEQWEIFIEKHPEIRSRICKVEEIISLFKDTQEKLGCDEVLEVWNEINDFNIKYKMRSRRLYRTKIFSVAASVILIISLGTATFFFTANQPSDYEFSDSRIFAEDTKLVLSGGEQISINEESTISINNNEQIIVNEQLVNIKDKTPTERAENAMNEVIVPYGKRSELLLADGTRVWINAGSKLAFPICFKGKSREVFLQGEACFEVAKNTDMPFIVNVKNLDIKVLGTRFNVSAYEEEENIETILVEGSVQLLKQKTLGIGSKAIILEPFQKAVFRKQDENIEVAKAKASDVYAYLAWTEGWLQFSQQNLKSVLKSIERYYNVEVVYDCLQSEEQISGKLDLKDSLIDVLEALSKVADIEYSIKGNVVLINTEKM